MIADMLNNKKPNPIVTWIIYWGRKPNISLAFIIQSYFVEPKNISLSFMHYFVVKVSNKQELQKFAFCNSSTLKAL